MMADQSGTPRTETTAPRGKNKSLAEKVTRKKELDTARGKRRVNIGSAFEQWRELKYSFIFTAKADRFILEECPSVTMEDTVHDTGDDTDQDDHEEDLSVLEQEQETQHLPQKKQRRQPYRSEITVEVEEDIIGKPASIAYHDCLRQLCEFVALPIDSCKGKDPITQKQCQAKGPFEINIKSRVTAAVIEWVSHVLVAHVISFLIQNIIIVLYYFTYYIFSMCFLLPLFQLCPQGHIVWRWSSQPTLKFGSQLGDFLMATNILLTGNNYTKVKMLFNFMNMGMINERYFAGIQDNYCVDTIKAFWNARRAKVIANVKTLGPTVALG